ncbi:DMT family transporter [Halobacillus mangrovi]|uniref:DMT family transporter n=1 Tax=Halobacillus mangrovi TaxID=402384 RepID=UPI003D98BDCC
MNSLKFLSSFSYGLVFVILAAFLWGIGGGLAGILLNHGWNAVVIAAFRACLGFLFILFWYVSRSQMSFILNKSILIWAVVAGIGMAGNIGFYFVSISYTSVPVASTLMYTAPIFVLILSALFKTERVTSFKLISALVVVGGIILLTGVYDTERSAIQFIGVLSGLLSGLSYAVFIFGYKNSSAYGNFITVLIISSITESTILLSLSDKNQFFSIFEMNQDLIWFLILGLIGAGLSTLLYVIGLKKITPGVASIVAMIEPVTASSFGILLLAQALNFTQLLGMIVIVVTITLLSYHSIRIENHKK